MTPGECRTAMIALFEAVTLGDVTSDRDRLQWVRSGPQADREYTLQPAAGEIRPPNRTLSGLRDVTWRMVVRYVPDDAAITTATDDCGTICDEIEALAINVGAIREAWVEQAYIDPDDQGGCDLTIDYHTVYDTGTAYGLTVDLDSITCDQTVM